MFGEIFQRLVEIRRDISDQAFAPSELALGFLSAFLIFTNLHLVHNYYAYSNGIFLIAAVSWVIVGLLERTRVRKFLGIVLFLICIFYSVNGYYGRLYNIQNNKVNPFNNVAFEIKSDALKGMPGPQLGP